MARSVDEGFDVFLQRLIPTEAQRVAGASHRASVKAAIEERVGVRRFRETGSFSHGTGVRNYSDIDLLVSITDPKEVVPFAVEVRGGGRVMVTC
jgi:predicted nucleotidyltransferase